MNFSGKKTAVLSKYHPAVLLVCFFSPLMPVMLISNPILTVLSLLCAEIFMISAGAFPKPSVVVGSVGTVLLCGFLNPLLSSGGATVWFYLNGRAYSLEAIFYGATFALSIICALAWMQAIALAIDSDGILFLFGKPFPRAALVCATAFRLLPMLTRRFRRQTGLCELYNPSLSDIKRTMLSVSSVVGVALEDSVVMANSMTARGFGLSGRKPFSPFRFKIRDGVCLAASLLLLSASVTGVAIGVFDFSFYPKIEADISTVFQLFFLLYIMLCIIPTVIFIFVKVKFSVRNTKNKNPKQRRNNTDYEFFKY